MDEEIYWSETQPDIDEDHLLIDESEANLVFECISMNYSSLWSTLALVILLLTLRVYHSIRP